MLLYFLFVRIAALFGHKKAKMLVKGQAETLASLQASPIAEPGQVVWLHAASVGEFEQARPIIERLRAEHPTWPILLTFFSPSGYEMRKNYDKVDRVLYLPFATRRRARAFLNAVQPKVAVFIKYEFWPAYLRELKKRDIPTYSVAAIFRDKQPFFRWWGKPYLKVLKCFTHIFVQDEHSQELLNKHGVEQVSIAGDTRFDRVAQVVSQQKTHMAVEAFVEPSLELDVRGQRPDYKVLVAGSTWPQDEQLIAEYVDKHPDVKVVLVPHEIHDEHLHHIFQMFRGRYVRLSEATMVNVRHVRVLVVDQMGLLSSLYHYGQAAYVGGGFGVGIHNTIEAAAHGVPVVFGPNYDNFREAHGLIACGAGASVHDYITFEAAIDDAFAAHVVKGKQAYDYVQSELGATDKVYRQIIYN